MALQVVNQSAGADGINLQCADGLASNNDDKASDIKVAIRGSSLTSTPSG